MVNTRVAVVLPGARYGPSAPLLMYASDAAEARGARIVPLTWREISDDLPQEQRGQRACEQIEDVLSGLPADAMPLLIGKSLGTYGAESAARRVLPAVWLTPLLTFPFVRDGLRRATAPFLLVGGTADTVWDGALARELTPHVLEVDGADHGMSVPGPLAGSAEVLGRVATAVERFLDEVVWPSV